MARQPLLITLIVVVALAALVRGWAALWFLCDDAFITFRYAAMARLGHGYVWNPPPMPPVEGYTSAAWLWLLHGLWALTGRPPPQTANNVSLICAGITVGLTAWATLRAQLSEGLAPYRLAVLTLTLGALVTHRGFLVWSSSGLETALFVSLVTAWAVVTAREGRGPVIGALAAAIALTRPDGYLFVAATVALLGLRALRGEGARALALGLAPLAAVLAHVLWRRLTYGAWLPNTFAAKVGAAWPEAGLPYLAWFVLEYALWSWPLALLAALRRWRPGPGALAVGLTLLGQLGYYTLKVGGDHFEFRVFTHLAPLVALTTPLLLDRAGLRPAWTLALSALAWALALPLPWAEHQLAQGQTTMVAVRAGPKLGEALPGPLRPLGLAWDHLRDQLAPQLIGLRHREHQLFAELQLRLTPGLDASRPATMGGDVVVVRRLDGGFRLDPSADARPLLAARPAVDVGTVGVIGWALPSLLVLDSLGLNDPVVARLGAHVTPRRMAHERRPPPGYIECFQANVTFGVAVEETTTGALVDVMSHPQGYRERLDLSAPGLPLPPRWAGKPGLRARAVVLLLEREAPLTEADLARCAAWSAEEGSGPAP